MSLSSVEEMLRGAAERGLSLPRYLQALDEPESSLSPEVQRRKMAGVLEVMRRSRKEYNASDRSGSGLSGGDAGRYADAAKSLPGGDYFNAVVTEALRAGECNACMKRIVAAPTAGSCGVLPAVLLPLSDEFDDEALCNALFVAAGFGEVIAARATLSGAEGGCQAEVGAASAMAAAALTWLRGGGDACADAAAFALGNLLGLVCDPVAGLVEIPCIKRNVVGAVNAVACANLALAGLKSRIPCDEVIDAMGKIGAVMPSSLRETGLGGLAATPTGLRLAAQVQEGASFPANPAPGTAAE